MTQVIDESRASRSPEYDSTYELQVSPYDRVAGLLIAMLVLTCITVAGLFILWISKKVSVAQKPVPVILDVGGGSQHGLPNQGMDIEAPDPEEVAEETDLDEPKIEETLSMVLDAVATRKLDIDDLSLVDETISGGRVGSRGEGNAPALGSGDGEPGLSRAQRWLIDFEEGSTLQKYARQLDLFGIELGVVGRGARVAYASRFSQPIPTTRTAPRGDEQRLHFSWQHGGLQNTDRQLLDKAGIDTAGKVIVQFISPETENRLAVLEKERAERIGRDIGEIRQTRFGVRGTQSGFEFFVKSQSFF